MATRKITKRIVDDEIECAAERETARQTPSLVTSLMLRSSNEHPDSEELELAETGLVRLPTGCKPAGFILGDASAARLFRGSRLGRYLGTGRRLRLIQFVPFRNSCKTVRRSCEPPLFNGEGFQVYLHANEARIRAATPSEVLTAF